MESSKIFIDTDSEITFILEKVFASKTNRIVLVVPDRASLLSSLTGLKLVKRMVDKSNKLLVIVTLDEIGANLAKSAGLFVVSRVGEINEDIWNQAQTSKFDAMKKDLKSHYVPEVKETENKDEEVEVNLSEMINEEVTSEPEIIEENDEPQSEEIESTDVTPETTEEIVPEFQESIAPEPAQVRINIDVSDLESEKIALGVDPEIEEDFGDFKPKFLSSDNVKSETKEMDEIKEENIDEESNEVIVPVESPDDKSDKRIRKTAPNTEISNLSFAVGKDIGQKKKLF